MQVVDSTALGTVYSFISSALNSEHTNCEFKLIDTVLRKSLDQSQNRIKTLKELGLRPPSKLKLEFLDPLVNGQSGMESNVWLTSFQNCQSRQ